VTHIDLEAIKIIQLRILSNDESFSELAKLGNYTTNEMESGLREVISEKLVNMNSIEGIHEPVGGKTMEILEGFVLGVL